MRLFRTFKRTMRLFVPVFVSWGHVGRCCDDFVVYYNHCRPHSACFGFTPGEMYADAFADGPFEAVELFDGRLLAHRFT